MPAGAIIAVSAAAGLIAGALGMRAIDKAAIEAAEGRMALAEEQADARIAEATRDTVDAAGKNTTAALDASHSVANRDADTRADIATMPATEMAVAAALRPDVPPWTLALAGYSLCISGAQGKSEGSAAFGCTKRGEWLDKAIAARVASLTLEERAAALDDRAAALNRLECSEPSP